MYGFQSSLSSAVQAAKIKMFHLNIVCPVLRAAIITNDLNILPLTKINYGGIRLALSHGLITDFNVFSKNGRYEVDSKAVREVLLSARVKHYVKTGVPPIMYFA